MKWRKVARKLAAVTVGGGAGVATGYEYNRRFVNERSYEVEIPDEYAEKEYEEIKKIVKKGVVNLLVSDGTFENEQDAKFNVSVEDVTDLSSSQPRQVEVVVSLDKLTAKQIHKGVQLGWFMWRTEGKPTERFQALEKLAKEEPNRSSLRKALSWLLLPV